MGMAQSILTNTGVATGGRIINAALGIVVTGLLTRLFGATHFGTYTLLLSYGALLQLAADFGLYLTLTREIAHDGAPRDMLSHVLSLRIALVLIVFGLGWVGAQVVPALAVLQPLFVVAAAGLLCQSVSQLLMGVFQRYGVVWRATVGDFIGRVAQIVGVVALSHAAAGSFAMISAFSFGAVAALAMHYLLLPRAIPLRPAVSWSVWKGLLQTSWPLGAMLLLNAIYFRIDALILAFFRDAAQVGHYGLAYRVIESGLFFPAMFGGLLLPQLSRAWKAQQRVVCQQLLSEGLRVLAVVGAYCTLVLLVLSPQAITLIAGQDFLPAAPLLRILSFALLIMFFGNLFGFTLVAINRQKSLLYMYAGLAVANAVANWWLIPVFGAPAAAATTVGTEATAMLLAATLVWRQVGFIVSASFVVRLFVVIGLTAGVLLVLVQQLPWVSVLVLATLFYGTACLLLGLISRRSLVMLTTAHSHT